MFRFRRPAISLSQSRLYSEQTFYKAFVRDISLAKRSIIIESPFITYKRFDALYPALAAARRRGIRIVVNTRDPGSHDLSMQAQAAEGIAALQSLDIIVLYTGNLHRKLAIIDHEILWEGSLNILSQIDSCEIMRRTVSADLVTDMIRFTKLHKWYTEGKL